MYHLYRSKDINERNRVSEINSINIQVEFWPILGDFTVTSPLLLSNHLHAVSYFEKSFKFNFASILLSTFGKIEIFRVNW